MDYTGTPIMSTSDGFTEEDRKMMRDAAAKVNTLHRIVTGESEPERGLVVRVDRIEQRHASTSKLTWLAVGTGMAAAGAWIKAVVSGHQ